MNTTMRHPNRTGAIPHQSTQRGFSLVEIMVALVLGLVIVAAVLQTFISTQQSARTLETTSGMQENERLALDFLGKYIRLAGYKFISWTPNNDAFPVSNLGLHPLVAGVVIAGGDNDQQGADSITFRYQGSNGRSVTDCLGGIIDPNQAVVTSFSLNLNNGRFALRCRVQYINRQTGAAIGAAQTEPILNDIENMQILYGVDSTPQQGGLLLDRADRYVTASQINAHNAANPADNWWRQVLSVRIDLLVRSEADNITQQQVFTFNGVNYNDRRLRHVVSTVIDLRNNSLQ
ncbi:MAG TPA: PilW family protein [Verrucomicrobiota bacterium]|nr:PilW family protein [Verrucomicrobiota bacterium]